MDTHVFRPSERVVHEEVVIGFVADSLTNERKGFRLLMEALNGLRSERPVRIRVMGAHGEGASGFGFPIEFLGQVSGDENLAAFYQSIDLFVIPSSYDNQPNTVTEALCCGVPVVGFPGSGVEEIIHPGVNGLIAKEFSTDALRSALEEALILLPQFDRNQIARMAHERYAVEAMAAGYREVIKELMAGSR